MTAGLAIPLHVAVHVLGLTAAFGLAAFALARRDEVGGGRLAVVIGGLLLALTHATSGAFLADGSWPMYLRVAGYAAIAYGASGRPAPGMPVVLVAVPLPASVAAFGAGALAAFAVARGRLGRTDGGTRLVLGLGLWATADLVARYSDRGAAWVSLIGSLSVAWWLTRAARTSLLGKSIVSAVSILLLVVLALASASGLLLSSDLESDALARLDGAVASRGEQFTTDWPRELAATGGALAGVTLAEAVRSASVNSTNLDARAQAIAGLSGIDLAMLLDRDGIVLGSYNAATQAPVGGGEQLTIAGDALTLAALDGNAAQGMIGLGPRGLLAVATLPLTAATDGTTRLDDNAGVLLVARVVSDVRVIGPIAEETGAEVSIVVGSSPAASTFSAAAAPQAVVAALILRDTSNSFVIDGEPYLFSAGPLVDSDGRTEGFLVLAENSSRLASLQRDASRSLFTIAILALLGAIVLAAINARASTRPISRLTRAAERVATGDLHVRVGSDTEDEIGRLAGAFDQMTESLEGRESELRTAAAVEAALRGELETVTASMSEALIATNLHDKVTTVNPAAAALLGLTRARMSGRSAAQVIKGIGPGGEPLLEALGGLDDGPSGLVRGAVGRGRRRTPVDATAAPLVREDGAILGRVYVLRDVTGEVEVERMKTEFLSNISHELRTPLTPIKGYSEVMKVKDLGPERTKEFAANISASARRLERIIGMLVDFAALEAGRMEVRLEPTKIGREIDEVLTQWREREPDRTFKRRVSKGLPNVSADPALLRRVMIELIDNALKFSDGTVNVTAGVDNRGRVQLSVIDDGAGIPAGEVDAILKDFHQGDGSATRRHGGLGLGLSIVRRIVERFDADIVIDSEVDVGTKVTVTFAPARKGAKAAPATHNGLAVEMRGREATVDAVMRDKS